MKEQSPEGQLVCSCRNVTDEQIRKAILEKGLKTVDGIAGSTGAGCDCGTYIPDIERILAEGNGREPGSGGN